MRFLSLSISITLIFPALVLAWTSKPALTKQMGYSDVINLWGAPLEKIEKEAKRQDIWRYADAKVIFDNGKVAAWTSVDELASASIPRDSSEPSEATPSVDDSQVEEILKDIMAGDPAASLGVPGNPAAASADAQAEANLMKMLP